VQAHALSTAAVSHARGEESILYGDSTPFPYDLDFLDTIRAAIECGVALLSAQARIDQAVGSLANLDERVRGERFQLASLIEAVRAGVSRFAAPSRLSSPAAEVLEAARMIVEREQGALDRERSTSDGAAALAIDDACAAAYQALERFLLDQVVPPTRLAWRLAADDSGYDAMVQLRTNFALDAHFTAAVPDRHAFARPRRAGELADDLVIRRPRTLRLDRLFVSEASLDPERIVLTLRRGPASGRGQRIEIFGATEEATLQPLDEQGRPREIAAHLEDEDRGTVLRLAAGVLDGSLDLPFRRQVMVHASLDGESLKQRHEPREVATRLLAAFAPVVREIARRSGAPSELILRRDLGSGRREAVFVRKSELTQLILTLPSALRLPFAPLGLPLR
jgi:hypothetical protein